MTDIDKHPADDPGSDSLPPADTSGGEPQDAPQASLTTPEPLSSLPEDDPSQTPQGAAPHAEEEHAEAPALSEDPSQHSEAAHPAEETSQEASESSEPAGSAGLSEPAEPADGAGPVAEAAELQAAPAEEAEASPPPAAPAAPPRAVEPTEDELLAIGRQWGLVDDEGHVRQRLADGSPGRILGPAGQAVAAAAAAAAAPEAVADAGTAADPEAAVDAEASAISEPTEPTEPSEAAEPVALSEPAEQAQPAAPVDRSDRALLPYVRKFRQITSKVDALERDVERAADRSRLIGRIHSLQTWLPTGDVLGDVDALLARLGQLEESCRAQLQDNLRRKEELSARAAELVESTAWTKTAEAFKGLQAEWKKIGPVPAEEAEALWARFRESANRFFERRKVHLDERDREQLENLRKKDELSVRAEELSGSTAWTKTAEALKGLQDEWRKIGPVPREQADAVWARFRAAMDAFFERRKAHFRQIDQELKENLRRKEELCVQAEELSTSSDWKATTEAIKAMQAEWKAIGAVPHKQSEAIWARFRGAIDVFFARSSAAYEERARERQGRQGEWKERLQETLDRKREQADRIRESIVRDDENLDRWRDTLATLRPGPRSAEIQAGLDEKMATVGERRASKQGRLDELEAAIKEIEGRLA